MLRFPTQSCLSNLAEFAKVELTKPEIACDGPTRVFHEAEGPYNLCNKFPHPPHACDPPKLVMDAAGKIMDDCNAHVRQLRDFANAPERIDQSFAKSIGREHFYQDVCVPSQKVGDLSGALSGVGPDAIKGNASLTGIHISKNMDSVELDGVQASASATVQGWASLNLSPPYNRICPIPSAFGGPQSRFTLTPLTLEVSSGSSTISATFGIAPFHDVILNRERKGFFIDPDSFDVKAKAGLEPIVKLLTDAAIKFTCTFDPAGASAFPLTELLTLAGTELKLKHGIDIKKTRIAWADGSIGLPVSWVREGEKTIVDKTLPLNVDYQLSDTTVFVTARFAPKP